MVEAFPSPWQETAKAPAPFHTCAETICMAAHLRRQLWVAPNSNKCPHIIKTNSRLLSHPPGTLHNLPRPLSWPVPAPRERNSCRQTSRWPKGTGDARERPNRRQHLWEGVWNVPALPNWWSSWSFLAPGLQQVQPRGQRGQKRNWRAASPSLSILAVPPSGSQKVALKLRSLQAPLPAPAGEETNWTDTPKGRPRE